MINTSDEKSRNKAANETEMRTKRRAAQAQVVAGLQSLLEADEQLLGFTRGLIAGGLRGKLTVGFEALFAPYVNIGLTERRIILQHVQPESGKPNEILPHSFPLSELQSVVFNDIETFGGEPAGRLALRLFNDQHFRLRFSGADPVADAQTIASVFSSLTSARPKSRTTPTQSVCPNCDQVLDRASKFCPYCGHMLEPAPLTVEAVSPIDFTKSPDVDAGTTKTEPPQGVDEAVTGGPKLDNETFPEADHKPASEWSEALPQVETVAESPGPEMPTEGHEAPVHTAELPRPETAETEGDRPL